MIWTIKFVTAWFVQTCTNVGSHTSAISVFITSSRTVKVLSFSSCVILWNVYNTKICMEHNRNFTAGNCPSRKWTEYLYCHPWCNFCSAYVLAWYFWWRSRGFEDKASESVQFGFFLSQTACCLSPTAPTQQRQNRDLKRSKWLNSHKECSIQWCCMICRSHIKTTSALAEGAVCATSAIQSNGLLTVLNGSNHEVSADDDSIFWN